MKTFKYLVLLVFSFPVFAGQLSQVPDDAFPVGVPATAGYITDCVGVANSGAAACTTYYAWKSTVGRFKSNYYRYVARIYFNGVSMTLKPLSGDTETIAKGITPNGTPWGVSSWKLFTSNIVTWDALGNPTSYGPGTPNDADDLGRIAAGASIYNPATLQWDVVPGAYAIYGLSNSGDAIGMFVWPDAEGGIEHHGMYRLSEYTAQTEFEDACTYPCLAAQGTEPTKARINASGVVTWHITFPTYPVSSTLGFRAIPGDPTLLVANQVAFSGINSMGDTAGSDKIYRIGGVIETIPLSLGFTQLLANGINDSGVVVGLGKIGTTFRAFIYTP